MLGNKRNSPEVDVLEKLPVPSGRHEPVEVKIKGGSLLYEERRRTRIEADRVEGEEVDYVLPPDAIRPWIPPFGDIEMTERDRERIRRNVSSWLRVLGYRLHWQAALPTADEHFGPAMQVTLNPRWRWNFTEGRRGYQLLDLGPWGPSYEELWRVRIPVDVVTPGQTVHLRSALIQRWLPPYENEPLSAEDRRRIVANIVRLCSGKGVTVLVS